MQYSLQGLGMESMLLQQQQQQQQAELMETKPIMLDEYNSDLNLAIESDGYGHMYIKYSFRRSS